MAVRDDISVVIADDHPVVLHGLVALLKLEPDIRVLAACADGEAAFNAISAHEPDIALLDFRMPKLNGLEVLTKVIDSGLRTRVVFLTASANDGHVLAAITRRAYGIVLKESAAATVVGSLRAVAAGRRCIPDELARKAMQSVTGELADLQAILQPLTEREREVLHFVAEGRSNKQIAESLGVTEGTVKVHLHNIYGKTGVSNRTTLAGLVLRLGPRSIP